MNIDDIEGGVPDEWVKKSVKSRRGAGPLISKLKNQARLVKTQMAAIIDNIRNCVILDEEDDEASVPTESSGTNAE